MADWDLTAHLLRLIDLDLRGLQWQNSGGKGPKPQPIEMPNERAARESKEEAQLRKLEALGMLPPGSLD